MANINVKSGVTSTGLILTTDSLFVSSGGTALLTTAYFSGHCTVESGGVANNNTLSAGAKMWIQLGGMATSTTVLSGASFTVWEGAMGNQIVENGGYVFIDSGAFAQFVPNTFSNLELSSDCSATAHSGTNANNVGIFAGGRFEVFSGGIANQAKVSGGKLVVLANGTANSAAIYDGDLYVSSGGTANSTTVYGGKFDVWSGGVANDVLLSGGSFYANGDLKKLTVHSGGVATVDEKGTVNSATISHGGSLELTSGGTAIDFQVHSGGELDVYSSGTLTRGTVLSGGTALLRAGTISTSDFVINGNLSIYQGAKVDGMQIKNGAQVLLIYGSLTNAAVTDAEVLLKDVARLQNTTVSSGGVLNQVTSDARIEDVIVNAGGIVTGILRNAGLTFSGGTLDLNIAKASEDDDSLVDSASFASIKSGSYSCTLTVADEQMDGTYKLINGATGFNKTLTVKDSAGTELGTLTVDGGETDIGGVKYTLALDDSVLSVKVGDGGGAPDLTGDLTSEFHLTSGMYGSSVNVIGGGELYVENGGSATAVMIDETGEVVVSSGGQMTGVTIDYESELFINYGGSVTEIEVNHGGWLYVNPGGVAKQITENGGYVYGEADNDPNVTFVSHTISGLVLSQWEGATVHSGTTAFNTVLNDGNLEVFKGGSAVNTEVNLGGVLWVSSGGTATGIVENGGAVWVSGGHMEYVENTFTGLELSATATVHSRTTAASTTIVSGGAMDVYDGTANDTVVNSRGILFVSKGTAAGVTVNKGGSMTIYGGAVTGIVENGGNIWFASSATVEFVENTFSGAVLDVEDSATVHSMTKAVDPVVNPGGILTVYSGGTATGIVENGGYVVGYGSVTMSFVENTFSGLVLDYASNKYYATVHSVTTAIDTTVGSNCIFYVSGGVASNTSVDSAGRLRVSSGGRAIGVTVGSGGNVEIGSGGKLAGRITIADGAVVSAREGSVIDFDLRLTKEGADALVSDISLITGGVKYTLTVDGTQTNGTYNLANNAAGFDEAITIRSAAGEDYGAISCGNTLNIDGVDYTLNNFAGYLTLSIDGATPPPTPSGSAKSDIDGNGVSDVMFVWTGEHGEGNYQQGYWLNGTATWQSAGSSHPAEWENLGCYDMTGDGSADSVLVGNVEVGGVKGAYIGYYADANDLPDGSTWVNIGYLNNADDIDWKNKVGNLTGGSANSIVWYAPELYALGAWTDGTDSWVTLGNSFGGDDWTLVGCGDFDGDGKDSVVMSGLNGQYFYAVGIDESPVSLGSANWSGWEVRAIGDFLGDGKDDMVLFHKETGAMVMCADGNIDSYVSIGQLDAGDWFVVGAGDYNGDKKDDLLVRQYTTGMLGYYSAGDTAQWVELGRGVDMNWTVIA